MLYIGEYNHLQISHIAKVGMYLCDKEGNEVLLPNKYILKDFKEGSWATVFIYRDSSGRIIATTLKPYIIINEFGFLQVRTTETYGAFLDWGLEKDLFVPIAEQTKILQEGNWYVVYLYIDEKSNRLVASAKINKFLSNDDLNISVGEEVDVLIFEQTPLGFNAIVNNEFKGLIYHNEIFQKVKIGDKLKGYVKKIREDNGLDISLQKIGVQQLAISSDAVFNYLQNNNGFLPLTDNSSPESIMDTLQMSKKAFKKSVGILYKNRQVKIEDDGIYLV
jgi:predicted RNA-binding protein (virulence factor B family)